MDEGGFMGEAGGQREEANGEGEKGCDARAVRIAGLFSEGDDGPRDWETLLRSPAQYAATWTP